MQATLNSVPPGTGTPNPESSSSALAATSVFSSELRLAGNESDISIPVAGATPLVTLSERTSAELEEAPKSDQEQDEGHY